MNRCLDTLSRFCEWSGTRPHYKKSEITAYDFARNQSICTESIKMNGHSLTYLPPDKPFRYLGLRHTILGSTTAEVDYILQRAKNVVKACKGHPYLYHQAVSAMNMVLESSFRYSAGMTL